jgi:hypothetical protein
MRRTLLAMTLVLPIVISPMSSAHADSDSLLEAYQHAESARTIASLTLNLEIAPIWVPHSDRFWFREQTPLGWRYILVDLGRRTRVPAFDHARLARAISRVVKEEVDADHVPLTDLTF